MNICFICSSEHVATGIHHAAYKFEITDLCQCVQPHAMFPLLQKLQPNTDTAQSTSLHCKHSITYCLALPCLQPSSWLVAWHSL